MSPRYLSLPDGATGAPSKYAPSTSDLQYLYAYLSDIQEADIAINICGEGISPEYPDELSIASFVMGGGIYVDWCGWPMYYYSWSPWGGGSNSRFRSFLDSAGVYSDYVSSFIPGFSPEMLTLQCYGAPFERMLISSYQFPARDSVIVAPTIYPICSSMSDPYYAYGVVGINAGNGWYFWASINESGPRVGAKDYANFIRSILGYTQVDEPVGPFEPPPQPGQHTCQSGYYWNGTSCVPKPSSGTPQCPSGYAWNGASCVLTTTVKTVNWPLIIGGSVAALGLIGVFLVSSSKE